MKPWSRPRLIGELQGCIQNQMMHAMVRHCTDKKENQIFLIFKEIQMGSGAKSYMRKGSLIDEEMHKYFHHI
jgi:hypothetical protein